MTKKNAGNEFLEYLSAVAELMAVRTLGATAEEARTLAVRITGEISQAWGGTAPYIGRDAYREQRDQLIAERFDGSNYDDLARAFGISSRYVRIILSGKQSTAPAADRAATGRKPIGAGRKPAPPALIASRGGKC